MIVKVLPAKPPGTGRPLGTYILDLKHETPGERLGPYISGLDTHKVEWPRHSNINADSPAAAIAAIEWHNAQNLRHHRISRWEHIVVSFAEGERPTQEQMAVIEDRLMEAIGFGDHPRISAVHRNTDNLHLHIGVSRIDPTTLKAEHPRHNHFLLQAEAARLELDLELQQERKTLLPRERREIDSRRALERELATALRDGDSSHTNPYDQLPADMKIDETVVFGGRSYEALGERLDAAHYAAFTGDESRIQELQNRDLAAVDKSMKGILMSDNRTKQQAAFEQYLTAHPELKEPLTQGLDRLKARLDREAHEQGMQHSRDPLTLDQARKQWERTGEFESREARIWAKQQEQQRDNSQQKNGGRPTPADALKARFEAEHAIAVGARKQAEQAVYDRFSTYHQGLSAHYNVRYEQEKLNPRLLHLTERQQPYELLRAERGGDRVQAQQMRAQQLTAARKEHPLPTWTKFLERESGRGDQVAARLLQQERAREQKHQHGHER